MNRFEQMSRRVREDDNLAKSQAAPKPKEAAAEAQRHARRATALSAASREQYAARQAVEREAQARAAAAKAEADAKDRVKAIWRDAFAKAHRQLHPLARNK